MQMNKF